MKKTIIFIIVIIGNALSGSAQADKISSETNFLIGFTKVLAWTNYADNTFIINCAGQSKVMDLINHKALHIKTGGKKIIAREATQDNMFNCNILFIPEQQSNLLQEISSNPLSNTILIVTEQNSLVNQGADISFEYLKTSTTDSVLSYRFDIQKIKAKNIKMTPEFIGYGISN